MADNAPQLTDSGVNASGAPTSFFEPNAPAAAFGGGIGAGLADIGQDAGALALKFQGLQNETNATNASANYMADLADLKGAYYAKQGQDAVNAAPQYKSDLLALRQKYVSNAANPEEQQMIAQDIARQTNYSLLELGTHVPQQQILASKQASSSRIENAENAAVGVRNTPDQVAQYGAVVASEVKKIGELSGWDADTQKAKQSEALGSFYQTVTGALLSEGKAQQAADMFGQVRGLLSAQDQVKIQAAIQPKLVANAIQTGADSIFQGTKGAIMPSEGANVVPAADRPKLLSDAVAGTSTGVPADLLNAVVTHESSWDANANSGVALGLGQVKPSTAASPGFGVPALDPSKLNDPASNLKFAANYLDGLARKNGLTDWNDPTQVGKVLQDYNGSSTKEQYAKDVLAIRGSGSGTPGSGVSMPQFPDLGDMLDKGRALVQGNPALANDPAAQDKMDAEITRRYHQMETETASQRSAFAKQFRDAATAAANGDISAPDLEPQIRALYPKAQADEMVQQYNDTKQAGLVAAQVKLAPAADLPKLLQSLDPGNDATIDGYAIKEKKFEAAQRAITQRNSQLADDPALYAFNVPTVKAAYDQMQANPNDPASVQAYVNETNTQQMRLGVPPDKVSVLSNSQAQAEVQQIEQTDPAQGNITATLNGMEKKYGPAWNDVLGSLQKAGLRPEYSVLASMTAPGQLTAQVDGQRMLSYIANNKGGVKALEEQAGPTNKGEIDKAIDDRAGAALSAFKATTAYQSSGLELAQNVQGFVRNLALYYAGTGQAKSGDEAVQKAVDGVINQHYDFVDSARVPKGQADNFSSAASQFLSNLKPDDISQNYVPRQFLEASDKDSMMQAAQRGKWVTNAKGDGVNLMGALSNGAYIPLRKPDGSYIGFRFSDMPAINTTQAATSPGNMGLPIAPGQGAFR